MDLIKLEKLQAMKKDKNKYNTLIQNLVDYGLWVLFFGLFISCLIWLPKLVYSFKFILFVVVPEARKVIVKPRCLFVLCNVIVVFLIGDSKRSRSALSTDDIYDEYMERKRNLGGLSNIKRRDNQTVEKHEVLNLCRVIVSCQNLSHQQQILVEDNIKEVVEKDGEREEESVCAEEEDEDVESEEVDELNKRIEDFIARIMEQRRLEARMVACRYSDARMEGTRGLVY